MYGRGFVFDYVLIRSYRLTKAHLVGGSINYDASTSHPMPLLSNSIPSINNPTTPLLIIPIPIPIHPRRQRRNTKILQTRPLTTPIPPSHLRHPKHRTTPPLPLRRDLLRTGETTRYKQRRWFTGRDIRLRTSDAMGRCVCAGKMLSPLTPGRALRDFIHGCCLRGVVAWWLVV